VFASRKVLFIAKIKVRSTCAVEDNGVGKVDKCLGTHRRLHRPRQQSTGSVSVLHTQHSNSL